MGAVRMEEWTDMSYGLEVEQGKPGDRQDVGDDTGKKYGWHIGSGSEQMDGCSVIHWGEEEQSTEHVNLGIHV